MAKCVAFNWDSLKEIKSQQRLATWTFNSQFIVMHWYQFYQPQCDCLLFNLVQAFAARSIYKIKIKTITMSVLTVYQELDAYYMYDLKI